jgi:flagellar protein FlgJ
MAAPININIVNHNIPSLEKVQGDFAKEKKAAQEFEAAYISFLYNLIEEKIEVNKLFGGGEGEKIFRSVLVDEKVKKISETSSFGLQEKVLEEILKLQEIKTSKIKGDL